MKKHGIVLILAFVLALAVGLVTAEAADGKCGPDAYWTLEEHGILVITGTGTVTESPWDKDTVYELVIEEGITAIGDGVFSEMHRLRSVQLPASLVSIGSKAFCQCDRIRSFKMGTQVVTIGDSAFSSCKFLHYILLPDTLETIGDRAFFGSELEEVQIPAQVSFIGEMAFGDCDSLREVAFLGDPPAIGKNAFSNAEARALYPIGNSLWTKSLRENYGGYLEWNECTPEGVRIIEKGSCGENAKWYIDHNGTLTVYGSGTVTRQDWSEKIYRMVVESGIEAIGEGAFRDMLRLGTVDLGDTVVSIGSNAFSGCTLLAKITIPYSVRTIGDMAFGSCSNLSEITFLCEPPSIAPQAFHQVKAKCLYPYSSKLWCVDNMQQYGGSLSWYPLADNGDVFILTGTCGDGLSFTLTADGTLTVSGTGPMDDYTFHFPQGSDAPWIGQRLQGTAYYIKKIVIEEGCSHIGSNAFYWCGDIQDVTLPSSLKSIGECAFYESGIPSLVLPEGVETLGASCFNGCDRLTDAVLPSTLKELPEWAFANCTRLENFTMGKNITAIGPYAFLYCYSLTQLELPAGLKEISEQMLSGTGLTSLQLPEGITAIGNYGISGTNIEQLVIPEGVTSIGEYAFRASNYLTSVWMPDTVTELGTGVFSLCPVLNSVRLSQNLTKLSDSLFSNCSGLTHLMIPEAVERIGKSSLFVPNIQLIFLGDVPAPDEPIRTENVHGYYKPGADTTYCGNYSSTIYGFHIVWSEMYTATQGAHSVVSPEDVQSVTVSIREDDKLQWVRLDGIVLERSAYIVASDGKTLTLTEETLSSLEEGEYSIVVGYVENLCAASLTVSSDAAQEPSIPEGIPGDVNDDGKADYSDALMILRFSIGLGEMTRPELADVNGDGKPDYSDALLILRRSIGLE